MYASFRSTEARSLPPRRRGAPGTERARSHASLSLAGMLKQVIGLAVLAVSSVWTVALPTAGGSALLEYRSVSPRGCKRPYGEWRTGRVHTSAWGAHHLWLSWLVT